MAEPFNPVYVGDYNVVSIKGNQIEIIPASRGKTKKVIFTDVRYVLPVNNVISKLSDYTILVLNPNCT